MVQDLIPDLNAAPRADASIMLETKDQDMQEFLARLKRKKMRRRLALACGVCLLIIIAALLWRILT